MKAAAAAAGAVVDGGLNEHAGGGRARAGVQGLGACCAGACDAQVHWGTGPAGRTAPLRASA